MNTATRPTAGVTSTADPRHDRIGLLTAGMVAGPLLPAVSFVQIPFREGFDMTKHAFSFLLIGPGGWLQIINYLLAGALYVICGIGLRAAMRGKTGRAAQILAGGLGAGLIIAGLFPPPPSFGYPVGAPAGAPAQVTTTAVLHAVGFGLGVLSFCALLFVLAVWFWRNASRRWAVVAAVAATSLLAVPPTSSQPYGTVLLYVVVTTAWITTAVLLSRIRAAVSR
ncbi:MAG TPA: DUF998 domain-containing protein [Propionibacteriaceae bacterium]|nr:DUF998 domain-containing protein [Propionibacteriaceae bacterium]